MRQPVSSARPGEAMCNGPHVKYNQSVHAFSPCTVGLVTVPWGSVCLTGPVVTAAVLQKHGIGAVKIATWQAEKRTEHTRDSRSVVTQKDTA